MRRLSVSSIAWPAQEMSAGLDLLAELDVDGVEVAPGQIISGWNRDGLHQAVEFRATAAERGLAVVAMQALLFQVQGCHVFASDASRAALLQHLGRVAELASGLGAAACVYGAPATRDPGVLPPAEAHRMALDLFAHAAPAFEAAGAQLTIEANPEHYGCRFLTRTKDAADFVRALSQPGVALQLDTGTILINAEAPEEAFESAQGLIGHFHVSEPDLAPVGSTGADHDRIGAAARAAAYDGWISIEMRAVDDWRSAVRRAVELVRDKYL